MNAALISCLLLLAPGYDALVAALQSDDAYDDSYKVRLQAAVLLGRSGRDSAVEPLSLALGGDPHYLVRSAAALALANLSAPRSATTLLTAMATDADAFVRQQARNALERLPREEALPFVLIATRSDRAAVRSAALLYLAREPEQGGEGALAQALGETPEVFSALSETLQGLPDASRLRVLSQGLQSTEVLARQRTLELVQKKPSAEAAALVLAVYRRPAETQEIRELSKSALQALKAYLPLAEIVSEATAHPDYEVRARALQLLGVIGGPAAKDILLKNLDDERTYFRGVAVQAVKDLHEKDVVPRLERMLTDPQNQRIRHIIQNSIQQLRAHP